MSYSQFSLANVIKQFKLKIIEKKGLFADITPLPSSAYLIETLDYNVSLALANNTEKARFRNDCIANTD